MFGKSNSAAAGEERTRKRSPDRRDDRDSEGNEPDARGAGGGATKRFFVLNQNGSHILGEHRNTNAPLQTDHPIFRVPVAPLEDAQGEQGGEGEGPPAQDIGVFLGDGGAGSKGQRGS